MIYRKEHRRGLYRGLTELIPAATLPSRQVSAPTSGIQALSEV
jgi:hypothetical protein